jgi:outer membrane lipoprotein LolB
MRRRAARIAAALLPLVLAACTTLQQPASVGWAEQRAALTGLDQWQASGKLALNRGDQAETGSLQWWQRQNHTRLNLSGPLGVSATTITSDGAQVEIRRGDDYRQVTLDEAGDAGAAQGWDLPLGALPYWIKGLPAPHLPVETLSTEAGLLRELRQAGWHLTFGAYGRFDDYNLPTRLDLTRGETRARLVIRQWQTGPAGAAP